MAKTEASKALATSGAAAPAADLTVYAGTGYSEIRDLAIPEKREAVMASALANFAGEEIREFDLSRTKFPSGGATYFTLVGAGSSDGEPAKKIRGIIVLHQKRRAYWSKPLGEGGGATPPDCWSGDGVVGVGSPGGKCSACPLNEFGTKVGPGGAKKKGKACADKRLLLFLPEGHALPIAVQIPPASLGNWKNYLVRLTSARVPYYGVISEITLKAETAGGGEPYAEAHFDIAEKLPDDVAVGARVFGEMFAQTFSPTPPEREESDGGPTIVATVDGKPIESRPAVEGADYDK